MARPHWRQIVAVDVEASHPVWTRPSPSLRNDGLWVESRRVQVEIVDVSCPTDVLPASASAVMRQ